MFSPISTTPSTGFPFHGLRMQRHIQGLRMVQLRHGRPAEGAAAVRQESLRTAENGFSNRKHGDFTDSSKEIWRFIMIYHDLSTKNGDFTKKNCD